jgi:hypothetical protein
MRVRTRAKNAQLYLKLHVDETGSPRAEGVATVVELQMLGNTFVSENLASEARL